MPARRSPHPAFPRPSSAASLLPLLPVMATSVLAACGNKGDLYLDEPAPAVADPARTLPGLDDPLDDAIDGSPDADALDGDDADARRRREREGAAS